MTHTGQRQASLTKAEDIDQRSGAELQGRTQHSNANRSSHCIMNNTWSRISIASITGWHALLMSMARCGGIGLAPAFKSNTMRATAIAASTTQIYSQSPSLSLSLFFLHPHPYHYLHPHSYNYPHPYHFHYLHPYPNPCLHLNPFPILIIISIPITIIVYIPILILIVIPNFVPVPIAVVISISSPIPVAIVKWPER